MAEERNYQADRNITRPRRAPESASQSAALVEETQQFDASRSIVRARRTTVSEEGTMSVPEEQEKPQKKQRVSIIMGIALTFIAILFDVSEFALDFIGTWGAGIFVLIGWAKDVVAFFFFPLTFWALKIPPWKGRAARKKMVTLVSAWIISFIPWLGAVMPETTIAVMVTLFFTWKEDMDDSKKQSLKRKYLRAKRVAGRFNR